MAKAVFLEKPKQPIIWGGRSSCQAYTYISKGNSSLPAAMSSLTDIFPFTTCSPLQVLQKFYKRIFEKQKKSLANKNEKSSPVINHIDIL